jgi:X box-binding protein 1
MRRKLKNRVAAQTARDRKKQRMSELEEALAVIEAENKRLQMENANLKQCTSQLSKENVLLKQRLCKPTDQSDIIDGVKTESDDDSSADVVCTARLGEPELESAVLTVNPLQQDLARTVIALTTTQLMAICIFMISLTHWWVALKSSPKTSSQKKRCSTMQHSSQYIVISPYRSILPHNPLVPPWWGSHQKNWNPSMN